MPIGMSVSSKLISKVDAASVMKISGFSGRSYFVFQAMAPELSTSLGCVVSTALTVGVVEVRT